MHNCTCTRSSVSERQRAEQLCRLWHICCCEPSAFLYVNGVATKGHFPICCHEITLGSACNDQPWGWISTQFILMKHTNRGNTKSVLEKVFIWRFIFFFLTFFNMQTRYTQPVSAMMDCRWKYRVFSMFITFKNTNCIWVYNFFVHSGVAFDLSQHILT